MDLSENRGSATWRSSLKPLLVNVLCTSVKFQFSEQIIRTDHYQCSQNLSSTQQNCFFFLLLWFFSTCVFISLSLCWRSHIRRAVQHVLMGFGFLAPPAHFNYWLLFFLLSYHYVFELSCSLFSWSFMNFLFSCAIKYNKIKLFCHL